MIQEKPEEHLLPVMPVYKLYKHSQLYVATFIGGPLAAGFMIAENFRMLGDKESMKKTWMITLVSTLAIFTGIFLIPALEKVPNIVIPLIYTAVAQVLMKKYQGEEFKLHLESGGLFYSVWRVVIISVIGLIISIIIMAAILIILDPGILEMSF